jgi:hypothetical protein
VARRERSQSFADRIDSTFALNRFQHPRKPNCQTSLRGRRHRCYNSTWNQRLKGRDIFGGSDAELPKVRP